MRRSAATTASNPVRVFVVDDQAIVRRAVRTWLESKPGIDVVGEAGNGEAALRLVARVRPHVVLMDLVMPGLGGVETIRRIAERGLETRVLALTSFGTDLDIAPALRAGAVGCLPKDADADKLVRAIRLVARRAPCAPPLARGLIPTSAAPR
jgi:DNA-binding NarL/FixJ family response regulator